MENPRPEKVAVVDEVRSRIDEADAVIVTEYRGLKVKDLASLRRSIAPLGAEYRVYKNTLVRLAASDRSESFIELVAGPTALTFVQGDAAAVTKALRDFARTNPLLVIKGGLLGNSVLGARDTAALADLPSRDVLLARLAGAMAAPMQTLAGLFAAVPRNFAYGLLALRDQLAAGSPIPEAASPGAATAEAPAAEVPAAEVPVAEAPTPESAATEPATDEEAPTPESAAAEAPTVEAAIAEAPTAEAPTAEAPAEEATDTPTEDAPTEETES